MLMLPTSSEALIESKLRAFGDLRKHPVDVPAFTRTGEPVMDGADNQRNEPMSEADLYAVRREIERRFLYSIPGHGTLMARDQRREFQKCIDAYEEQLKAHAMGLRGDINPHSATIVVDAITLVASRASHAAEGPLQVDAAALAVSLGPASSVSSKGSPVSRSDTRTLPLSIPRTRRFTTWSVKRFRRRCRSVSELGCSLPGGERGAADRNSKPG